ALWNCVTTFSNQSTIHQLIVDIFRSVFIPELNDTSATDEVSNSNDGSLPRPTRDSSVVNSHRGSEGLAPLSGARAHRRLSIRTRFPHPENLRIGDILNQNGLYTVFLEYMDSIGAPPYLRFLTHMEIMTRVAYFKMDGQSDEGSTEMSD